MFAWSSARHAQHALCFALSPPFSHRKHRRRCHSHCTDLLTAAVRRICRQTRDAAREFDTQLLQSVARLVSPASVTALLLSAAAVR